MRHWGTGEGLHCRFDRGAYPHIDFDDLFTWPEPPRTPTRVGDILQPQSELAEDLRVSGRDRFTISDKLWAGHNKRRELHRTKGNGFGYSLFSHHSEYTNTISARYYKDGSEILIDQSALGKNPRKLTPRECANLQGFPEEFIIDSVSQGQIYKQFGNSVCMNVIHAVSEEMRIHCLPRMIVRRRDTPRDSQAPTGLSAA